MKKKTGLLKKKKHGHICVFFKNLPVALRTHRLFSRIFCFSFWQLWPSLGEATWPQMPARRTYQPLRLEAINHPKNSGGRIMTK